MSVNQWLQIVLSISVCDVAHYGDRLTVSGDLGRGKPRERYYMTLSTHYGECKPIVNAMTLGSNRSQRQFCYIPRS